MIADTPWILYGRPYSSGTPPGPEALPKEPDTSDQERAKFGMTHAEVVTSVRPERWALLDGLEGLSPTPLTRRSKLIRQAHLTDVYLARQRANKIDVWRFKLPIWRTWVQHRDDEKARLQAEADKETFVGQGLCKAGTQIEVGDETYLIGDINKNRGICDDCTAFDADAIVTRYRVLYTQDCE